MDNCESIRSYRIVYMIKEGKEERIVEQQRLCYDIDYHVKRVIGKDSFVCITRIDVVNGVPT